MARFAQDHALCVIVENGNIESALKRFKKRVEKFKIMDQVKKRMFYTKPSAIKQMKAQKHKHNLKKVNNNL